MDDKIIGNIVEFDHLDGNISQIDHLSGNLNSRGDEETVYRGYSAYEIALQQGFEGSKDEWLRALVGPQGETGVSVSDVRLNLDYTLTVTLNDGTEFTTESIKGDKGDKGQKGDKGDKGDIGTGISFVRLNDDYTLTIIFSDGSDYKTHISIRGEKGQQGVQGVQGPKGDTGERGPQGQQGIQGIQGPKGQTGQTGPQGIQGPQGEKGQKGDTGEKGEKGQTGPQGEPGAAFTYEDFTQAQLEGLRGPQGIQGIQGQKGDKGQKGDTGLQGPKGDTGEQGPKGDTGQTGPVGPQGPQGLKGDKGDKGDPGVPGTNMEIHICSITEYDANTRVPTIVNPNSSTFYLVPTEDGTSPDLFTEWVYVNGAWEMFGSASVDLTDYVKNTDYATGAKAGVIKLNPNYGINVTDDGILYVNTAESKNAKMGTNNARPITPIIQHESTFYGLAKAAGHDEKDSTLAFGTYSDNAKSSIQNMLGITDKYSPKKWVAESETELVTNAHSVGDLFYIGETLYKVIADLNAGDAINVGVNVEEINANDILDDYVTKEDVQDNVSIVEKSASGSIASFTDGADNLPLKSLIVDINPIQDLHGQDAPYPAGGGKNKLPTIDATQTINGVTWTLNSDGSIKLTGTATANSVYDFGRDVVTLSAGTYTTHDITVSGVYTVTIFKIVNGTASVVKSGGGSFTLSEETSIFVRYVVLNGTTANTTIYPQVESGSTATAYAPYSNICPISGWDEVNVTRTGKNLWDEEWEDGTIDPTTGKNKNRSGYVRSKNYISVVGGEAYNLHMPWAQMFYYDQNKEFIRSNPNGITEDGNVHDKTLTIPTGCYYIRFRCTSSYGATYNHDISINYPSTATPYSPYTGRSITIDLGQTVYGGKLDVLSGELVIDRAMVDLGTLTWNYISGSNFNLRSTNAIGALPPITLSTTPRAISSIYPALSYAEVSDTDKSLAIVFAASGQAGKVWIHDSSYTDAQTFKTAVSGQTLVYELAEPITIQLTPNQVNSLLGVNNIWADTGNTSVEYFSQVDKDLMDYIETSLKPYAKEERLNDYVSDVQINGTSIVENGVVNMPTATTTNFGVMRLGSGLINNSSGVTMVNFASQAGVKTGSAANTSISPARQHESVFYGLAKAAGDVTQSQSSNAVGNYTEDAKSAISDMLNGAVQVNGTDPTIVAKSGIRYVCGEVLSLNFTPSASGICDVVFISGSTPTVLTIPNTIKWANGFDPTSLDVNTTYELNVMDGLGVACAWT